MLFDKLLATITDVVKRLLSKRSKLPSLFNKKLIFLSLTCHSINIILQLKLLNP
jgi:hypothetical protein